MIILVCGGRSYSDLKRLYAVLNAIHAATPITRLVHGSASGADLLAAQWARENRVTEIGCPAEWQRFGRSAGPIRNEQMLIDHKPDLVVAFPGGAGTRSMIGLAREAGVEVRQIAAN